MIIILNDHDYVLYQLYQEPNYAAPSATEIKKNPLIATHMRL